MTRKILMIPFHYPPMVGSSGVQRSVHFSATLKKHNWDPIVLTAHTRVYPEISQASLTNIDNDIVVKRAFAIDVSRHLPFGGYFPKFIALPDRWSSWVLSAVVQGWWCIKKFKPKVIWSTYPIASAHLIAYILNRISGVPWVADFRDPMTEEGYPEDPTIFNVYRWIEERTIKHASYIVVTTLGAQKAYQDRYGEKYKDKIQVIQNGFDEDKFLAAEHRLAQREISENSTSKNLTPLRVVHSGSIFFNEQDRNPETLFEVLSDLKSEGKVSAQNFKLELRATGCDDLCREVLNKYSISDLVYLMPLISHEESIEDLLRADGLLLLQGSNFNDQIAAKTYEYIRAGKQIIALTDEGGNTAKLLKKLGFDLVAGLRDKAGIEGIFAQIEERCREFQPLDKMQISKFSRQEQTATLANILNACT